MHSIRIKITAVTLLAIVVSVLTLGSIAVFTIGVESDANSAEKMQLISENERKSLDAYLNSLRQSVDMADYVAVDYLVKVDLENYSIPNASSRAVNQTPEQARELDAFLSAHCDLVESAFGSVVNNIDGVATYFYCINANLGSSEHGFFFSRTGKSSFEEGDAIDSRDLDPQDADHTAWYYTPIQAGAPVWVGPYRAHHLGDEWAIAYVVPTYKDNTLVGVIGMDILLSTMIERISGLAIYDTGFACLLGQDGRILYHPAMEAGSVPEAIEGLLSSGIFQQDSSNGELIRYDVDGQERQLAFSTLSNGMKLVVAAPVSEITASQRQLTGLIVLVAIIVLVLFAIIVMVYMGAVTEPLKRLTAASRRLAAGDYDVELSYDGKDEVGVLTKSFRHMRDELRRHIADLNSRASTDALTGVRNKGAYDALAAKIDGMIDAAAETAAGDVGDAEPGAGAPAPAFGLILLDCNDLKLVNDEHGHANGDLYLQAARRVICRVFAHSPVFRMGGDEFAVVLQGEDYANRDRLLSAFDQMVDEVNVVAKEPWSRVSLAKGMATFRPGEDTCVEQVMKRADERMYEDKRRFKHSGTRAPEGSGEGRGRES